MKQADPSVRDTKQTSIFVFLPPLFAREWPKVSAVLRYVAAVWFCVLALTFALHLSLHPIAAAVQ